MSLEISRPDARRAALGGLIDYAGLFPPTELDMESAVAEYRAARSGAGAWIVDRFLCTVTRLEELGGVLTRAMEPGEPAWRVSAVAAGDLDSEVGLIEAFDAEMGGAASVRVVETKVPPGDLAVWAARAVRALDQLVFFEIPWQAGVDVALDALVAAREDTRHSLGAKIRTGGLSADDFPPPEAVAAFIAACHERSLPMKATAGLHHPFRHLDPDTGFTRHGFLNLLAAAALANAGESLDTLARVVADDDAGAFSFDRSGLRWRGHSVSAADLQDTRRSLFVAYGSCSFDEPVEDLTALGVLPVGS
ncbi:MAG TPA: hypothetical protein VK960_07210 [Acidimicrobiia bacterium]|nr:hypothetical protein [Acidimicrobiia bacterium]